jgi:RNA polymerase sigma-70 factor (ECF subfamily)
VETGDEHPKRMTQKQLVTYMNEVQHVLPSSNDLKDTEMHRGDHEEVLARQAQQGDRDAFLELYQLYFNKVHNRVKSRVPAQHAEDVTQEIFIAVVRSLEHFEQRSKFSTWLYTIVNRQIAEFYRRRQFATECQSISLDSVEPFLEASDGETDQMDDCALIQQALNELPVHYQDIILSRFADGLTFIEIAEQRGQSLEAVKSLYRRAIQSLRSQMDTV